MKLRICFICDEYPPISHGGIGVAVKLLAEELVAQGNEVYVVGLSPKSYGGLQNEIINGVNIYRIKHGLSIPSSFTNNLIYKSMNKVFNSDFLNINKAWIKQNNFIEKLVADKNVDIIEFTDFRFSFSHLKIRKRFNYWPKIEKKILKLSRFHGSINFFRLESGLKISRKELFFENSLISYCDHFISVSSYTADKMFEYYNINPDEITTIPNAINIDKTNKKSKRENIIIFSGSLVKKKGIIELLKSWNIVCENNKNVILEIYGKGIKIKFIRYVLPEYRNKVKFKGHLDRKKLLERYLVANLAIFPSHSETFGLAPLESMMMGCPTIGSKTFVNNWYNTDENAMIILDSIDEKNIAKEINTLLNNESLRKRLSINGEKYVKNNFDIRKIAERNINVYKELLRIKKYET